MAGSLAGKVCLVTGAASGIGLATALEMAEEGAVVIGTDVATQPEGARSLAWASLDVTDESQWKLVVAGTLADHGRLDVLVNNAGLVYSYENIVEISIEDWKKVVDVNQFGVFLGMRSAIPAMLAGGGGSIVNISSIWGLVGAEGVSAYQASKGAVTMMSRNAAATWAAQAIRVNSVHPGFIETPLTSAQDREISDGLVSKTPMLRAGRAQEVAEAVAFLASDRASFITGVQLPVDGGFTAI